MSRNDDSRMWQRIAAQILASHERILAATRSEIATAVIVALSHETIDRSRQHIERLDRRAAEARSAPAPRA